MTPSAINGAATAYVYDGNGHRVMKSTGTAATTYVYDAMGQLIAEYGNPTDSGTKYISVDHLGSTRLVTDTAQNQEICYDFLPFGELIPTGTDGRSGCYGSTATPLTQKFTGKERDSETNNDFFQARYMSAFQMRFTSPDPLGNFVANAADPQSWNMYAYTRNNPLAFVDPTGLDYCDLGGGDTSYDPSVGGLTQGECSYEQGTWVVPTVNDTVTGGQNELVMTLNLDGWLSQWSAENGPSANGPLTSGLTFYATGTASVATPSTVAPRQTKDQCVSSFLTNNYGNFLGEKIIPDFSLISIATNFWGYAKSSALTLAVEGSLVYAPKALSWAATTTGNNLAAYPGMAAASADALETGAFWATTATTAEWLIAPVAVGATAFSTTADAYANWSCRSVQ